MAGTAGLDERFVSTNALEQYFVDKDTGTPLAGGSVEFWQDDSRTTPKLVYQLTGDPSNIGGYSYDPLPNPVTLSGVGTIQNAGGDNIALYYFPFQGTPDDSTGATELYYVVVKDYLGVVQFTRNAWPNVIGSQGPTNNNNLQTNQISNSQFVDFHYYQNDIANIAYTGASTQTLQIAPDWNIVFNHSGAGTLVVAREPIAGSSKYPTNPPYWLRVTPGSNISNIKLVQNMPNNPAIWSTTNDGITSYVAGGLLLDVNVSAEMYYVPSAGSPASYELVNVTNNSGSQKYYTGTVEIFPSTNNNDGENGGISIEIVLSSTLESRISSVQIVGLSSSDQNIPYVQETANRQRDLLFHYYRDPLVLKAISSYLIGWDFPLNPAQFGGRTQAASLAAGQSKYVWDQTILFQSVASGFSVAGTTIGALQVTSQAVGGGQFALIQYVGQDQARNLLSGPLCVQVSGNTNMAAGLNFGVSLWYTTDANLPSITSNLSLVSTLDANGIPATFNGSWTQVPVADTVPNYGTLPFAVGNNGEPVNFPYWDPSLVPTAISNATYFAIVVGTSGMTQTSTASFRRISLVPGFIATAPAPQSRDQVLRECQYYYQKSYDAGTIPGTGATYIGMKSNPQGFGIAITGATNTVFYNTAYQGFELKFKYTLRRTPVLALYSPVTGASGNVSYGYLTTGAVKTSLDVATSIWLTSTPFGSTSASNAVFSVFSGGPVVGDIGSPTTSITYHYVADARLGVI